MTAALSDHRLVFVAPDQGQTAVGDYAQDLVDALRPHFGEIVEERTLGPGLDTLADIRRHRQRVRPLIPANAGALAETCYSDAPPLPRFCQSGIIRGR